MACFKKLRTTALLATTLLGSISFVHGMETVDDEVATKYTKLSFSGIELDPDRNICIKEENADFYKLTFPEAQDAIETLCKTYESLSVDDKIPFIKIRQNKDGSVSFKQEDRSVSFKLKNDEITWRILTPEDANTKLQAMLLACGNAGLITTSSQLDAEGATTEEEDSDQLQLQRLKNGADEGDKQARIPLEAEKAAAQQQEETARIQAETLRLKQEAEQMRAELARQQQVQAAENLRIQQEEIASIKAQLLAQAESLRLQQEAATQAEAHRREQEAALQAQLAAQAETLRLQQEAAAQAQLAAQAETIRLQQEAAAQAEALRQQREATAQAEEQQKLAILGNRTPERVEKNINREIKKGKKHLKKLGF